MQILGLKIDDIKQKKLLEILVVLINTICFFICMII